MTRFCRLLKPRYYIIIVILVILYLITAGTLHLFPFNQPAGPQKPESPSPTGYDYYLIIDEQSGQTLMYIPVVATVGDEVLSENNKLYQIVRVEENRAYARFIRDINLEKYKPGRN